MKIKTWQKPRLTFAESQRLKIRKTDAELLRHALTQKPLGGKAVYILNGEVIEIDYNYNPPIVRSMKDAKKTN